MFSVIAASMAALKHDDVFRVTVRRIGFLDRTATFDNNKALQSRIEAIVADTLSAGPPPRSCPHRDELLKVSRTAVERKARQM